jgi:2-polyprenyl-3-methyl-5-hydroxy-6-metoxy-1,4-benzoquinol methylase
MHRGKAYHDFMLASRRDRNQRDRFHRLVFQLVQPGETILDFGAGTGIDAKCYVAHGQKVLVYEPSKQNLGYLVQYCHEEIAKGAITITDLSVPAAVRVIAANFAVLNLIADHKALFQRFAGLVTPDGLVFVSLLNPFFLGDARYAWWRKNVGALLNTGSYIVEGEFGPIYRFAPSVVVSAAAPAFRPVARFPRGPRLLASRYMFMLFQRR